jgi:hypothetical protein
MKLCVMDLPSVLKICDISSYYFTIYAIIEPKHQHIRLLFPFISHSYSVKTISVMCQDIFDQAAVTEPSKP